MRLLLIPLLAFLAACEGGFTVETTGFPEEMKAKVAVVERRCAACHSLRRVFSQRRGAESWGRIVREMSAKPDARIPEADRPAIVEFLTWYSARERR